MAVHAAEAPSAEALTAVLPLAAVVHPTVAAVPHVAAAAVPTVTAASEAADKGL